MKTTIIICIFSFFPILIFGQTDNIKIKKNKQGIIEYIKFPSSQSHESQVADLPRTSSDFIKDYLKPNLATSFIKIPHKQRNPDFIHEHYDQYYKGVRVDGAGFNFHFEKSKMYLAHGNFIEINDLITKPTISAEYAKENFAKFKDIPLAEVSDYKSELLIKQIADFSNNDTIYSTALVFQIYLITGHLKNDEFGFIDAHTGEVLCTEPSMTGYSATGTFATRYNDSRQATTQYFNNTYNLRDSSRNAVIHTFDIGGTTNLNNGTDLTDSNNIWTAAEHSSSEDDMGLDIHWALQEIYDYLDDEYGINSFDNPTSGNGHDIEAYFHWGEQNAAKWKMSENVLVFGNGDDISIRPLASLDIVAHEFGHGISDIQIGWAYSGDLRIFHEGLSDIWGVIFENRINPNSIWEMGEQVSISDDCSRNKRQRIQNKYPGLARRGLYGSGKV